MARDFQINGPVMVRVKGMVGTGIQALTDLGLTQDPVQVTLDFKHRDIKVDAWGSVPPETQFMLSEAIIDMTLVHYDPDVLNVCLRESMGGAPAIGAMTQAGARMGNGVARFAVGNHFIGLNLTSPVNARPWRFFTTFMTGPPMFLPLGTEKSVASVRWRALVYDTDLYNNGVGAYGQVLWDHTQDA